MLYGFIGIVVILIFIMIMVLYARGRNQTKSVLYKSHAEKRGYEYYQTSQFFRISPVVKGKQAELSFEIFEEVVGYGKSKRTHTMIKFPNSPFDFEFKIGKEHFFSKMGKVFGFRDIEFRNDKFDRKFLLKSKDEDKFRAIMPDGMQVKLMEVSNDIQGTIENNNGQLTYNSQQEIMKDEKMDSLYRVLNFMIELQNQR
jgi:hypothetical protein